MKKKYLLTIVMTLIMAIVTAGCGMDTITGVFKGKQKVTIESPFEIKAVAVVDKPVTDIYFDATLSMQGYTTIKANNFYRQLPDELMDIGGSAGDVNFYSFGKSVKKLSGYDYRKFIDPDAYTELENSIKDILDATVVDHLTIIVTDLFETDSAWSAISTKMQEKYFSKKCSVAVVGFKNPFQGTIYDVGLDFAKIDYNSGADPNKFRPVYMLVMGPDSYVNNFIKSCQEKKIANGTMEYVKLSNTLMADKPAGIFNMPEEDLVNVAERDNLTFVDKDNVVEYKINKLQENVEVVRSFKYVPDTYGCKLDFDKIRPQVILKYMEEAEGGEPGDKDVEIKWNELNAKHVEVTVTKNEEKEDTYDVHVKFKPEDVLKEKAINGMLVQLIPESDGFILPGWLKQWTIPGYIASDITAFDGSKTVNLQKTIESLKKSVLKYSAPTLINMEMYFDLR